MANLNFHVLLKYVTKLVLKDLPFLRTQDFLNNLVTLKVSFNMPGLLILDLHKICK